MLAKILMLNFGQFPLLKDHMSREGENHENKKAGCNPCITTSDKSIVRNHSPLSYGVYKPASTVKNFGSFAFSELHFFNMVQLVELSLLPIINPISGLHILLCLENFLPARQEHQYPPSVLWQIPPEGHGLFLHSSASAER